MDEVRHIFVGASARNVWCGKKLAPSTWALQKLIESGRIKEPATEGEWIDGTAPDDTCLECKQALERVRS